MNRSKEFQPSHLRDKNRRKVFRLFQEKRELSKSEIASELNTSVQTITKILDFFLLNNYIMASGEAETLKGRRPLRYVFCPNAAFVITAAYDGRELKTAVVNMDGDIRQIEKIAVKRPLPDVLRKDIIEQVRNIIDTNIGMKFIGAGLALPGIYDRNKHVISGFANADQKETFDLQAFSQEFYQEFGLEIYVSNDVNAAAYAESKKRCPDMIYLSLGSGIGAGLVLNGMVYEGKKGRAGEIGYLYSRSRGKHLENILNIEYLKAEMDKGCKEEVLEKAVVEIAECIAQYAVLMDIDYFVVGGKTVEYLGETTVESVQAQLNTIVPFNVKVQKQSSHDDETSGVGRLFWEKRWELLLSGEI